jgi:hypothetical protein
MAKLPWQAAPAVGLLQRNKTNLLNFRNFERAPEALSEE